MGTADEFPERPLGGLTRIDVDRLESLLELSGSLYACAADPVSGVVLGEFSRTGDVESDRAVNGAVLGWGRHMTALLTSGSAGVEDVMLTTDRSFHILRQVAANVAGGRILVYCRLDRGRANLAVARRALAAISLHDGLGSSDRPITESSLPVKAVHPAPSSIVHLDVADSVSAYVGSVAVPNGGPPARPVVERASTDRSEEPASGGGVTAAWHGHLSVAQFSLPRRLPSPAAPERVATAEVETVALSPVLSRAWSTDVDVLRRLIDGLRRLA